ncbi:(4Fe-4S)-binding protein [Acetobacterium malicum]|uniref:Ferredoxin n=1 Tax=Acetobacterium malicum TaxID=52692 RepID=A0ABR6YS81_9FIRM|nr:4Fe-4S binding protein [Acetobacterium malicum]MBC3898063.1 (4Fe-4S)-binding protein [Acetobacterium malicum]
MQTKDYLDLLKNEIHSTVIATVDSEGFPQARVIDIMLVDENNLYFITARGKAFYSQLINKKFVAISGMTSGEGTLSKKAISIHGKVEAIGKKLLERVFEENPYMAEIYQTEESRMALEVFRLYEGQGEFFDLSVKPIVRESFAIGNGKVKETGYYIKETCNGCGTCIPKCPQNCIERTTPYHINQKNCILCGNCYTVCPFEAVEKRN